MKRAFHTACVVLAATCTLSAQHAQTGAQIQTLPLAYPADVSMARFAPFLDASGNPVRTAPVASIPADIDGDANRDLVFLNSAGEIAVQFANTAGLGRFYARDSLKGNYTALCRYRTATSPLDHLLAVDPIQSEPLLLHWNKRNTTGDPRDGFLGGFLSGWTTGTNVTEIATADHAGDGHDDIVVLREIGTQGQPVTQITLLSMGVQKHGFLWVEEQMSTSLGVPLEALRLLDINGDKKTDVLACARGIGLVVFRQDNGALVIHTIWPTTGLDIRDMQVGDIDGNGRDDIAVALPQVIVAALSHDPSSQYSTGFEYRDYNVPTGVGPLHQCRILDAHQSTSLLVGLPTDGRNYVLFPENPGAYNVGSYWVENAPASLTGPGTLGQSVVAMDVDNDHDLDLVLQAPDGKYWMTLRNPEMSFAPTGLNGVKTKVIPNEGDEYNVTVTVPRELVEEGALFVEVGCYVVDPTSNPADPDYLYWGRLTPAIDPFTYTASFSAWHWEESAFDNLVRDYKQNRHINFGQQYVYPSNVWETIRTGPRMFLTVHGVDGSKRYESKNGKAPPKKAGSALGGKWVLTAKPPSVKGDRELLPWE